MNFTARRSWFTLQLFTTIIIIVKTQFESKISILTKLCQCPKRGNDQRVSFFLRLLLWRFWSGINCSNVIVKGVSEWERERISHMYYIFLKWEDFQKILEILLILVGNFKHRKYKADEGICTMYRHCKIVLDLFLIFKRGLYLIFCDQAVPKIQIPLMFHQEWYSFVFGTDVISVRHDFVCHKKL